TQTKRKEKLIADRPWGSVDVGIGVFLTAQPLGPTAKELVFLGKARITEVNHLALHASLDRAVLGSFRNEIDALVILRASVLAYRAHIHIGVCAVVQRNFGAAARACQQQRERPRGELLAPRTAAGERERERERGSGARCGGYGGDMGSRSGGFVKSRGTYPAWGSNTFGTRRKAVGHGP